MGDLMTAPRFYSSSAVFDQEHHWSYRVILASMAGDAQALTTGVIVRAVLAKQTKGGPAWGSTADIDLDGIMRSTLRMDKGIWKENMPIGSVVAVRDSFRFLADHCRLTDAERLAFFEELRKWVRKDYRALTAPTG